MDEAGLAAGASEVGPPRALEEAVAEAYEPRWRCCLCFWERFNDGNAALLLLVVSRLLEAEESEQESWPPNEEEEELPEDDDRAAMVGALPPLSILLMLPVFILIELLSLCRLLYD